MSSVSTLKRPREWVMLPGAIVSDPRVSAGALRVLLAILTLSTPHGGSHRLLLCDATTFELACLLETQERHVKAHVALLSDLGYLAPAAVRGMIGWRVQVEPVRHTGRGA